MPVTVSVIQIVVQGTAPTTGSGTKNIFNIFNYRQQTGPAGISPVTVANSFILNVWTTIAAALSTAYTGVATLCRYLDDATTQFQNANVPGSGLVAGARLPTSSSVSILLRGLNRGKNWRGRKAFGPIAESQQTSDELNAAGLTAWNPVLPLLSGILSGGGFQWQPVVLSRVLSKLAVNPTTIQTSDVASALLNKTLGTMRRRKERTVR